MTAKRVQCPASGCGHIFTLHPSFIVQKHVCEWCGRSFSAALDPRSTPFCSDEHKAEHDAKRQRVNARESYRRSRGLPA